MSWQLTVLEWLKKTGNWLITLLGLIALWGAAGASLWSALETRRTADTVAEMEKNRLDYEKNRYTSEIHNRYRDFIERSGPIIPCAVALNGLSRDELKTLLHEPEKFHFNIKQHAAILACLPTAEKQRIKDTSDKKVEWSEDHGLAIRHKIVTWVNQLDSMLLAFNYKVANQFILCNNLSSFTMQKESGQTKILFGKIKELEIWGGVPNLWDFMNKMTEPKGCDDFPGKPSTNGAQVTTSSLKK